MNSPYAAKENLVGDTPLFLFDCTLADGSIQRWSSQTVSWNGNQYEGRVIRHNLFEAQIATDTQVGGAPRLAFELANADSVFSQVENQTGFKGGQLTVRALFADTAAGAATSDPVVVFRGLMNSPDLITENVFRLSAMNRMSMQRTQLPEVTIQRLCPWRFPITSDQRTEAVDGGASKGKYSPFYRCGYSADKSGGTGNLNSGAAYTSCAQTRTDCVTRGMFNRDSSGNQTGRYGGFEYVPAIIPVRAAGQSNTQLSAVQDNLAAYNDPVPLVYGTQWHVPDVVFLRNDGNLTRMEVLLSMGEIQGVTTVLVNDVIIPQGVSGSNMTSTGWWNLMSAGTRNGVQDPDFGDGGSGPIGDPYGSMAYLSVVVPNRISDGTSIPSVQVLMQGLKVMTYDSSGNSTGESFSSNPAWVLLDILRRSAYTLDEIDTSSFALAAAYCDGLISYTDPIVGQMQIPRFQCNFALKSQRSAGEIIRSLRNSSRIYLVLNTSGLIEARIENTFALQQPALPAGSNATQQYAGGWPAYEFDASSIARNGDGSANFRVTAKGAQDTPNRLSVSFQDEFNQYQQDSLSLTDADDSDLCGQFVSATLDAMGISNFSHASRALLLGLNRGIQGNQFVEFDTSVKALGLTPGDLITVTYQKENLSRTAFRILRITPGAAFRTATIFAQVHNDAWYSDSVSGIVGGHGWQSSLGSGLPSPVTGTFIDANGVVQLGISETEVLAGDGSADAELSVSFTEPGGQIGILPAPLVSLVPTVNTSGGSLPGGSTFFYGLSTLDSSGGESPLSFLVQATTSTTGNTSSATLTGIGLPATATGFNVYRGAGPMPLQRIASNQAPASSFTDSGLAPQLVLPPDPLFDHVNLYWRWELVPECAVTVHSASTVGNGALQLAANRYRSAVVRITRGKGAGQEAQVVGNTNTVLTVDTQWGTEPDSTSFFTVAESTWRSGNSGAASPLTVDVPERVGNVVQISARAADANDNEATYEASPLTRWTIGSSGGLTGDAAAPPQPTFALDVEDGTVTIGSIGFPGLQNTTGIGTATCTLCYFDELAGASTQLSAAMDNATLSASFSTPPAPGTLLQIDQEIMIAGVTTTGATAVTRAVHGTTAASHAGNTTVYLLGEHVTIMPFVKGFFGTPAGGDWTYSISLPDVRIASAEMFVTNALGDSPVRVNQYTGTNDFGLRTMAGGQYSFQVTGYLAVQTGASPDAIVDSANSVRDVYAVLREPPSGAGVSLVINRNGQPYASLQFAAGASTSSVVNGFGMPALAAGDRLSLDVTGVGTLNPGSDLTVIIRL